MERESIWQKSDFEGTSDSEINSTTIYGYK